MDGIGIAIAVTASAFEAHVDDFNRAGPAGHPVQSANDGRGRPVAEAVQHPYRPKPSAWCNTDHVDIVVERTDRSCHMGAVPGAILVVAKSSRAIRTADEIEVTGG